jgi:hypothetical protein
VVGNARAVNCPGVLGRRGLRGSLGERVGASSCRRMQALASMAGLGILKTNLNSDSYQPRQPILLQIKQLVLLRSIPPRRKSRIESRFELTGLSHSEVHRKNGTGPQLNDPIGRRTGVLLYAEVAKRVASCSSSTARQLSSNTGFHEPTLTCCLM